MADTSDIKKDIVIMFKDAPHSVVEFQHVNPGKGSAFVRTRLKNVQTGKVFDQTYKSGEAIEMVDLERTMMQYLYKDADNYYFMDNKSFEQIGIANAIVGEKGQYLKEGMEAQVALHNGIALNLELPKKLTFKVTQSDPGVKGDTASGRVTKEATLETGMKIAVPLFIKEGDMVVVNSETGEYVERA